MNFQVILRPLQVSLPFCVLAMPLAALIVYTGFRLAHTHG